MNQDKAEVTVERLVRRIEEVNGKFLEMMGARIKDVGEMSVTDAHRLIGMREYGADVDELTRELARITDKNTDEIHELYEAMAKQDYDFAERFYQARGKTHIPFEENETLRRFVDTVAETTAATYRNMSRSTAFQIPDGKGGMKLSSLAEVYNEVMDKAVTAVTTGQGDYMSEMRDVMTALADSGIRTVYTEGRGGLAADYASGYSRRLDTAVRQNLLWGVKQCAVGTQERIAADIGADGYEVDYHRNPRPSHAPMGGVMFAIGEAREVNGKRYESFEEKALPFLEEYGCLHFATAVVLGVSEPRYDEEELAKWKAEDAKTFTFEGKEYNGYEATQAQRKLEARIRNRKDRVKMAESAGDTEKARVEQMRLNQTVQKYGAFSRAAGLRTKYERMYVAGYRPVNVGNALQQTGKHDIIKLPNMEKAVLPESKFINYALDPVRSPDKATAFEMALGYNQSNYERLIANIKDNLGKFSAVRKQDSAYGVCYEVKMTLTGENGKTATVKTGWLIDKGSDVPRLTSVYVAKKGKAKNGKSET